MAKKKTEIQKHYRLYTDRDVDVTKRIEDGRTLLTLGNDARKIAQTEANRIRSYIYEVFALDENHRKVSVGFGVPK